MGVLRFFRWFFFSIFILSLALFGVGHFFAISDMTTWVPLKGGDDGIYLSTVLEQLDTIDFLGRTVGEEVKVSVSETGEPAGDVGATPIEPATSVEASEVGQLVQTEEAIADGGYTLDEHSRFELIIMKLGVSTSPMSWITEPLGIENTQVTLSLFVGYCALLLSFIFHVITKKHKTFYGTLLMIIGFIFIFGLYIVSYYPINKIIGIISETFTAKSDDYPYVALVGVIAFSLLGVLIGAPIFSCGIRQITCNRLKKRLRRRGASVN